MNQKLSDLKIDKNWKIFLKLPENLLKIFKENLMILLTKIALILKTQDLYLLILKMVEWVV